MMISLVFQYVIILQNITVSFLKVPSDTINRLIIVLLGDISCDYS